MSSDIANDRRAYRWSKLKISYRAVSITVVAVASLAILSYGYSTFWNGPKDVAAAGKGSGRGQPTRVVAAEVVSGEFPVVLTGLGTVTPSATAVVKTRIAGHLVDVDFKESQYVKSGDVLANVDPRPYQLALAQAEGQLQKDLSLLQNAERDLGRYEALIRKMKDVISAQQVDTQRSLINQYKGTVAIDRALVEQARLNLSYCKIVSPIDGRVGLRQVDQGNYVQPGDANGVAVVTKLSPITVVFTLPESQLSTVLKRTRAGEQLAVVAYDHDRSTELARGHLIAVDNQIDTASGTVKLRAEFANEDERLFPNQFVNADLMVETLHGATLAPSAAIQQGSRGPFVYAIREDATVQARPVKLGPAKDEQVVISEGLAVGEKVVVEGVDRLREGAAVTLPAVQGATSEGKRRPVAQNNAP
jgi:multidrug efflux system membrane fusion protein